MNAPNVRSVRTGRTLPIAAAGAIVVWMSAAMGWLCGARAACEAPQYSTTFAPDAQGEYAAGFMYWTWRELFPGPLMHPPEVLLLAEVIEVCPPEAVESLSLVEYPGRLRVERVVRCSAAFAAAAARLRTLYTTALYDLNVTDRVLVGLIEYEGALEIPRFMMTNCVIGHRLGSYGNHDEETLVPLLATERGWQPDSLSFDELRLWAEISPRLVAEYAIGRLEAQVAPEE